MNKLILQLINDKGVIWKTKEYKSLKHMEKDINIPYHNLREIHLYCTGRKIRNLHNYNQELYQQLRIIDMPRQNVVVV